MRTMANKGKGRKKETRNANRMGGTSSRPDGREDAYLTIDTPSGPHRMRTTKPNKAAEAWLLEARYLASQGAFNGSAYDSKNLTLGEFVGRWLEDEIGPTVRAVTFANYEKTYRLRIQPPPLGTLGLASVTVANCQAWRSRLSKEGVSASEQGKAIRLLKWSLEQALAWEMIPKNPASHLKAPRYKPKETPYLRAEDVPRYLEAVRGDPFEALFVVAMLGGPRPAELLALRWEDFDEAAGTLRIDESVSHLGSVEVDWNEPKSEMGLRILPLAGEARHALAERRRRVLKERLASETAGGMAGFEEERAREVVSRLDGFLGSVSESK
jgi:integrase